MTWVIEGENSFQKVSISKTQVFTMIKNTYAEFLKL